MKKMIFQSFKWIFIVSKRFSRVDRNGRSAVTSFLATLGIAFGVMTLIVVMSVMNGFQMSFIDSILELSSYHIRIEDFPEEMESSLIQKLNESKQIVSYTPFYEAQALVTGKKGGATSVLIRALNQNVYEQDPGFKKEMQFISGSFDFSKKNSIVLGASLARNLGVHLGDSVNLMVRSGGADVNLFSNYRIFTVSFIFSSGY